jgi:hypothetical protein
MVLSLNPIDEGESQFQRLQTITSIALGDLLLYFQHQWMYGVVSIQMWDFHDINHRTNNISEGEPTAFPHLFHSKALLFIICIFDL